MRKTTIQKIKKLEKLMESDFFSEYTETDKKDCIKALIKDLGGNEKWKQQKN